MLKVAFFFLHWLCLTACHPLMVFNPRNINSKPPASDEALPKNKVRITVDSMGIPYIKAANIHDAMYGLGWMQARDRLFQIDLMRHAALGELSEWFGERTLASDKKLRVLTYRLDEQMARLSAAEDLLLDHFVAGINDGARERGRTAEHFLLGAHFADMTKRDVIAIARLQGWQLAHGLDSELTNLQIARADNSDAIKQEFIRAIDDRGTAIVTTPPGQQEPFKVPAYLKKASSPTAFLYQHDDMVQLSGGASNAWAVSSMLAKGGYAELYSDPHLQHTSPSNFYLATIDADDVFATGATFPGLPGILIGANRELAWGVTASLLNTQDIVLLSMVKGEANTYVVDGKKMLLTEWPQKFCTDMKGTCQEVMQYISIFGPVVDSHFDAYIGKDDRFAIQWTGFAVEEHTDPSGGFIRLAHAHDVNAGMDAVKNMSLPGEISFWLIRLVISVTLTQGLRRIAMPNKILTYRLISLISSSRWAGFRKT